MLYKDSGVRRQGAVGRKNPNRRRKSADALTTVMAAILFVYK